MSDGDDAEDEQAILADEVQEQRGAGQAAREGVGGARLEPDRHLGVRTRHPEGTQTYLSQGREVAEGNLRGAIINLTSSAIERGHSPNLCGE